jgi:UDP-N-acetylmuramyl pentapeptide phosphotransferase/UDP-N-acetylglucosamine-1-phosphate transferase
MKYFLTILALAVGVAIGAIAIVLGEGDDSPGLQVLGALIVVGMIALGVRTARQKGRRRTRPTLIAHEHAEDTRNSG